MHVTAERLEGTEEEETAKGIGTSENISPYDTDGLRVLKARWQMDVTVMMVTVNGGHNVCLTKLTGGCPQQRHIETSLKYKLHFYTIRAVSTVTGLEWPRGFQEVKVPRFHDNRTGWW
jgi:hypothetical protein